MSRLEHTFAVLRGRRAALIAYIVAGEFDGDVALMHSLVDSGADVIELAMPFSDPMAEGVVIQRAHERALRRDGSMVRTFELVTRFRTDNSSTPVVLMGYLNPIEAMGYERFADRAVATGVDGVLVVDLPPEESTDVAVALRSRGLDLIYLVAPTTAQPRLQRITAEATGFLYCISLKGTTGSHHLQLDEVHHRVKALQALTNLPIAVGFGISDPSMVAAVGGFADAVVVGSALVAATAEVSTAEQAAVLLHQTLAPMRRALDAGTAREVV